MAKKNNTLTSSSTVTINPSTYSVTGVYTGGGGGGSGSTYTGTGATWSTIGTGVWPDPNSMVVKCDAVFEGNIKIKGRDLTEWLEEIDSRLGMLQINKELEDEFNELKSLGDAYRDAEKRFLEQKKIYEILKKTDE